MVFFCECFQQNLNTEKLSLVFLLLSNFTFQIYLLLHTNILPQYRHENAIICYMPTNTKKKYPQCLEGSIEIIFLWNRFLCRHPTVNFPNEIPSVLRSCCKNCCNAFLHTFLRPSFPYSSIKLRGVVGVSRVASPFTSFLVHNATRKYPSGQEVCRGTWGNMVTCIIGTLKRL